GGRVSFKAPALGFSSSEFVISSLSNVIDENGLITRMTLKNPDAYLSDDKKKKEKKKKNKQNEDYSAYWGD
ncbi:MAG: hypothetical protein RR214_07865, partial [Synergistaceae bacterium]